MDYKYFSKEDLRSRCISETMRMVRNLTCVRVLADGTKLEPLTQLQLAGILNLTQCQMSRISTGVCVASGPVFYRLHEIYKSRLENGLV